MRFQFTLDTYVKKEELSDEPKYEKLTEQYSLHIYEENITTGLYCSFIRLTYGGKEIIVDTKELRKALEMIVGS